MLALTPELHAVFAGFLRERIGLHYGFDDRDVLSDKLTTRAQDAGFESLLDYYYHLRYDAGGDAELANLVDSLVVNESYMFRELEPLRRIVELVEAVLSRGARARIWSAACASGEEPLTLAMLLDERQLLGSTDIIASDVSTRTLARARAGRWSRRALRDHTVPALVSRYLRVDDRAVHIDERLIRRIDWRRINLVDAAQVAEVAPCDVILCRNVLIYFDDDTVVRVVRSLVDRLVPDGHLFVGIAESLMRFSTALTCEEHGGVFCYRKASR